MVPFYCHSSLRVSLFPDHPPQWQEALWAGRAGYQRGNRRHVLPRPHRRYLQVATALPSTPIPHGPVSPMQAQAQLQESSQKLDLLRLALEKLMEGLPPAHPLRGRVARELRTAVSGKPQPSGTLVKPTAVTGSQESLLLQSSPSLPERTLKHNGEELWRRVPALAPPPPSCVTLGN